MDRLRDSLTGLFLGILACLIISMLCGCKSADYMPVTQQLHDSIYVDRWHRDSVYMHDSVFVNQYIQGDTVFVDKLVTKYRYKDRWRYDTVAVVRADSVRVPYPVEKDLSWWQQTRLAAFPILTVAIIVLAFIIAWLVKKLKKK